MRAYDPYCAVNECVQAAVREGAWSAQIRTYVLPCSSLFLIQVCCVRYMYWQAGLHEKIILEVLISYSEDIMSY